MALLLKNKFWLCFVIAILGVGLLLRYYAVFILSPMSSTLQADMALYLARATDMANGIYKLNQNFQPLGYTVTSWWLRALGGWDLLSWIQVFVSWGSALLIFLIALEHFGMAAGLISLVLAVFHLPGISYTSFHLAECIYTFLITLSVWWILKTNRATENWKYFVTGLLLMVSFYFKGTHAFFIPVFCLWLLFRKNTEFKAGLKQVAAVILGGIVVMIPQLTWTSYAYGKAMAGPSAGALNFVEGKCPWKYNLDSEGNAWIAPLFLQTNDNPAKKVWPRPFTDEAYFWEQGLKCVQKNPWVLVSSVRYVYYLFFGNELWPTAFDRNFVSAYQAWKPIYYFILLPFSLLGWIFLYKKKSEEHRILTLLLLSVFLMVFIFKSENRFRVPFDLIFIVWSSYALVEITKAASSRYAGRHRLRFPKKPQSHQL